MVTFDSESLYGVIGEVEPLLRAHYLELAKNQDRVALDPDWARYAEMERQRSLVLFTARSDDDLIGYACFFVSPHPHYQQLTLVSNDVLFLAAQHRAGMTGVRFIRHCEQQLRARYGAFCLTWHAKEGTTLTKLLPRLGYGVQDIVFSKLF